MGFMLQAAGLAVDAEYHASKSYSGCGVRMLSMRCDSGGAIIPCGTYLGWVRKRAPECYMNMNERAFISIFSNVAT